MYSKLLHTLIMHLTTTWYLYPKTHTYLSITQNRAKHTHIQTLTCYHPTYHPPNIHLASYHMSHSRQQHVNIKGTH